MQFFFAKDAFFHYKADAVKHAGAKNVVTVELKNREDTVPFLNALIAPVGTEVPAEVSEAHPDVPFGSFEVDPEIADFVPEFMKRDWQQRRKYAEERLKRDAERRQATDDDEIDGTMEAHLAMKGAGLL